MNDNNSRETMWGNDPSFEYPITSDKKPNSNIPGDQQDSTDVDLSEVDWGELTAVAALGLGGGYLLGKVIGELFGGKNERTSLPRLAHAARRLNDKQYNLFISHSWKYSEDYDGIAELLDSVPSLRWQDHSVPVDDELDTKTDEQLRQRLRDRMRNASVILTSAGMYGSEAYSEWIPEEHQIAVELDKPVIAIRPEGQQQLPNTVSEVADTVVGWDRAALIEAIAEHG